MSQVRNLRAMFEQRGELSPPDRGRTPGGTPVAVAPESPRPLSRVRTNFIAVEKDGRMGLQRDPSVDSSLSTSRQVSGGGGGSELSFTAPSTPQLLAENKRGPVELASKTEAAGVQTPAGTPPGSLAAPTQLAATPVTPTVSLTPPASLPTAAEVAAVNAESKTQTTGTGSKLFASRLLAAKEMETQANSLRDAAPVKSTGSTNGVANTVSVTAAPKATSNGPAATIAKLTARPTAAKASAGASQNSHPRPTLATAQSKNTSESKTGTPKASPTTAAPASTSSKHAPKTISTTKANARASTKASTAKTPTSPAKPLTPKLGTKTPEKKSVSATEKSYATTTQPVTAARRPSPLHTVPHNGTGFVKPKPKSPTKPMQLPPGLTTHTTASATKLNAPRQSLSRMSGHYPIHQQPAVRSASRNSISTATSSAGGTRSLKRQNSTINRPRPSIGPPPKPAARDHPVTKKEKEIDEGFLARMMRPTQASASKTVDKTQLPIVRKHHPVATTKPHTSEHSLTVKKHISSETAKKAVSKTLAVRASAATSRVPSRAPSATHSIEAAAESAPAEAATATKEIFELAPAVKLESQTVTEPLSGPAPEPTPTEEPTTESIPELSSEPQSTQAGLGPEEKQTPVSVSTPAPEQEKETEPVPALVKTASESKAQREPEAELEPQVEAKLVEEETTAQTIPVVEEKAEAVEMETILDTTKAAQPEPAPHVDAPIIEDLAENKVQAIATTDVAPEETEDAAAQEAILGVHVNGIETY